MSKKWFVLIVKSRNEIKVSEKLTQMNVEVYCPMIKEVRTWSDRKKTIQVPLFRSYVFVYLTEKERQAVFVVPGIIRYLFWLGRPAVISAREMSTLQNWLSDDHVEEVTLSKIVPGERITIKNGALKDKVAIVQEVGKKRVRLVVQGLGVVINIRLKDVA